MKIIFTTALLLVFGMGSAFAQAPAKKKSLHDRMTGQQYGIAGCGLGSIVFGDQSGMVQIAAATLNGTGGQTFGITSGTSNCVDQGAVKDAMAVPMFIEVNKSALAKDASRGEGETLASLAQLMGCDSAKFSQTLKSNFQSIFVDSNMQPAAIESKINQATQQNQACGA